MKALCIESNIYSHNKVMPSKNLIDGVIYNVAETDLWEGITVYQLQEFPDEIINGRNMEFWFDSALFIPLSEISETEFNRNYNKQTA